MAANGSSNSDFITLRVRADFDFRIPRDAPMSTLLNNFLERTGDRPGSRVLLYNGLRFSDSETPTDLQMRDFDIIDAREVSSSAIVLPDVPPSPQPTSQPGPRTRSRAKRASASQTPPSATTPKRAKRRATTPSRAPTPVNGPKKMNTTPPNPDDQIQITVRAEDRGEFQFKIKRMTSLKKLKDAYCSCVNKPSASLRFEFEGLDVEDDDTADFLQIRDQALIDVYEVPILKPKSQTYEQISASETTEAGATAAKTLSDPEKQQVHVKLQAQNGDELLFKINRKARFKKLKRVYCTRTNKPPEAYTFVYDGHLVRDTDTPSSVGMQDLDVIFAFDPAHASKFTPPPERNTTHNGKPDVEMKSEPVVEGATAATGVKSTRGARTPNGDKANHGARGKSSGHRNQVQVKVRDPDGNLVLFQIRRTAPLRKLMDTYCRRAGEPNTRFMYSGHAISREHTAATLQIDDDAVIDAWPPQLA